MRRYAQALSRALTGAMVMSLMATAGWSQPSLTWLGTLGDSISAATGVSADGRVVVGWASNADWQERAFRWENGVMEELGTLPGGSGSRAHGVSADGGVVVGSATNAAGQWRAFRWENGVMQDLGTLGGLESEAYGVSSDGGVVVGDAVTVDGWDRAFRWKNGVMQDLGPLPGYEHSWAYDVSADGRVVVGWAYNFAWQWRAFRWENGLMQDLGTLGGLGSVAHGVSADGRVVVGTATNAAGREHAFRWENGEMEDLGTLPGGSGSRAYGVSADGGVVVGRATNAAGRERAFRWTPAGGMEDLNRTYTSLLTDESELRAAFAISPNGRYIVGQGYNAATGREEAFLLDVGSASDIRGSGDGEVAMVHISSLYPNPADESVTIGISSAAPLSNATLVLYDALGRAVATVLQDAPLPEGTTAVPISLRHLPAGTYTVVLRTSAGTVARQLVIAQ